MTMTLEQEQHLISIIRRFESMADAKYRAGQAEHTGNLWDLSPLQILDNAIDESLDQVIYLITLRDKLMSMGADAIKDYKGRL